MLNKPSTLFSISVSNWTFPGGKCFIRMALKRIFDELALGSEMVVNSTSSPTHISRVWNQWNVKALWCLMHKWLKLTVSKTSVKWKNKRTFRSTQRKKPNPSFNENTTPCSRRSPDTSNVWSISEIDVARCNWSRRSVASRNWTQSPWRNVKSPF